MERLQASRAAERRCSVAWIDVDVVDQCIAINVALLSLQRAVEGSQLTIVAERNVLNVIGYAANLILELTSQRVVDVDIGLFLAHILADVPA